VFELATPVSALYVPVLTAFTLFLVPGAAANAQRLNRERWLPALALMLVLQAFLIFEPVGIVFAYTASPTGSSALLI
jgi:hypothetical protein